MAKKPQSQPQTQTARTVSNPWLGRGLLGAAGVGVLLVVLGYLSGAVSDGVLGVVLALIMGALTTSYVASTFLEVAHQPGLRVGILVIAAITVALAVAPVVLTIYPGTPVATGALASAGDTMPVPDSVAGPVRVFVHAGLNPTGPNKVDFLLKGFTTPLEGSLERTITTSRVGRRGTAQQAHERNSEFLDGRLAAGHTGIQLASVTGLTGAMSLQVFSDRFPLWLDLVVSALVLAALALLAARLHPHSDVVVTGGIALAFGAVAHEFVTPDSVIKPLIGAVIVAGVLGGAAGGVFAWAGRKIAPAPATTRARV